MRNPFRRLPVIPAALGVGIRVDDQDRAFSYAFLVVNGGEPIDLGDIGEIPRARVGMVGVGHVEVDAVAILAGTGWERDDTLDVSAAIPTATGAMFLIPLRRRTDQADGDDTAPARC